MNRPWKCLAAAGCLVLLAACSQPPGTTLIRVPLNPDEFFTTGARQRIIANSEIAKFSRPGMVDPIRIVCTEPSPDAAVAVANSLGVGLSVLGQGAGSISSAQVEGLAQLVERTASIQLLRDKMYQTCLAYANGAISGTTYSMIMSRLDDTIVTLLLGETAGGAFGRKLAGIGLEASAEASATLSGFSNEMSNLDASTKKLAAAEKDVAEKEDKLAEAEAKPPPNEEEVKEAKKNFKDAKANRDALLKLLQSNIATASEAGGKVAELKTGGGLSVRTDPQIAQTLADMQASFLIDDYTKLYLSACLVELALQEEDRTPASLGFDYLAADLVEAKSKLTDIPKDEKYKEKRQGAQQALSNAQEAFSSFVEGVPLAEQAALNPNNTLFKEFLAEWKENPEDSRVNEADLIATAGISRSSKLATFCVRRLPEFLHDARQDFEKFRTHRETLRANVKLGEAGVRVREAEAKRLAEFQRALGTCGELTVESESKKCRELVLSGTLPALKEAPEE